MTKWKFIATLLMTFCFSFIYAQNDLNRSSHEIGLGVVFRQSKDYCLNKTRYQGLGWNAAYNWNKIYKNQLHNVSFDFMFSNMKNRYDFLPVSIFASPEISYAFAQNISTQENFENYLGGQINLGTNIWYYPFWDDSHMYWHTNNNLAFYNQSFYPYKNGLIEFAVSIPLIAFTSRPSAKRDYKMDKKELDYLINKAYTNMKWETLNKLQAIQLTIAYQYRINSRFANKIQYKLNYTRSNSNDSRKLFYLDHGLQMIFIFDRYEN